MIRGKVEGGREGGEEVEAKGNRSEELADSLLGSPEAPTPLLSIIFRQSPPHPPPPFVYLSGCCFQTSHVFIACNKPGADSGQDQKCPWLSRALCLSHVLEELRERALFSFWQANRTRGCQKAEENAESFHTNSSWSQILILFHTRRPTGACRNIGTRKYTVTVVKMESRERISHKRRRRKSRYNYLITSNIWTFWCVAT